MPISNVPCAGGCGSPLRLVKGSLPAGIATCHPCRRQGRGPRKPQPTAACPVCGASFPLRMNSRSNQMVRTCSPACGQLIRSGRAPRKGRICAVCGQTFDANNADQATCSPACGKVGAAAKRPPARPKLRRMRPVAHCSGCARQRGEAERWRKWCSYRCRVNACGARVLDLYRLACGKGWSGANWRKLLVGYLRERDGSKCAICAEGIDFDVPSGPKGDDRGVSIDHVIPRSEGGPDDLANLRLAHWACNRDRKTGSAGEVIQLALVG